MSNTSRRPNNRIVLWIGIAAAVVLAVIMIALIVPQPVGGGKYSVVDHKVTIEATSIGALGSILSTDKGHVLYTFAPDAQQEVTCYDRCALHWPPVFLPDGVNVAAGPGVDGSLLGDVTDRDGKRVATYDGWPLYLYQGDVTASTASGHGQYLDGGYWYVIRTTGEVVTPSPQQ